MKLACNIDSRGIRVRLIGGCLLGGISILLAIAAWWSAATWLWWPAGGLALGSAVMIFEARRGWCVLRAMGFKTRI